MIRDKNGRLRLVFQHAGTRRTLRLGRVPTRAGRRIQFEVEQLAGMLRLGLPPAPETMLWLSRCREPIRSRLAACGLAERPAASTLAEVAHLAFAGRRLRASTRVAYSHTIQSLLAHFGPALDVRRVTPADADAWRNYLLGRGLSGATVARRTGVARDIFAWAIRSRLVQENPFRHLSAAVHGNAARAWLVPAADVLRLMEAAPSASWRALLALARWGGLRVPSEPAAMTWAHVDWGADDHPPKLTIRSPKTEHIPGHERRVIPLFPQIRQPLEDLLALSTPAPEDKIFPDIIATANLRTQLHRLARRAGVRLGPKPWTNMRATRDAELRRLYPAHIVCQWIGHSERVAREHYLLPPEDTYFTQAAAVTPPAATKEISHESHT